MHFLAVLLHLFDVIVISFTSSVELISAIAYKLKHDTIQKLTCNFKNCEEENCNKFLQWLKYKIITMIKIQNVLKKL